MLPTSHHPLKLSCGLIIESPQGWLLVRVTKRNRWDLPKGGLENGETPKQAALRECLEETGLDWSGQADEFEDLGRHPYLPHKDLHLFRLRLPDAIALDGCSCSTWGRYTPDGEPHPETDAWEWVMPREARMRVGRGLLRLIDRLHLVDTACQPAPHQA